MNKLKHFIYKGFYYPVIGSSNGWINGRTKQAWEKRIGGYDNYDKWWSFSIGIKCRLYNPDKPYKQFVIDKINNHREMKIVKRYWNDYGLDCTKEESTSFMYYVEAAGGVSIGDIRDAYYLSNLNRFCTHAGSKQICCGYNPETGKFEGWSHRARVGFEPGDYIFEELQPNGKPYPDDTQFTKHGSRVIQDLHDARESALNFAAYIS